MVAIFLILLKHPHTVLHSGCKQLKTSLTGEIVNHVQQEQRIPGRINPERNTLRNIVIKLTKMKHKDKILKETGKTINNMQQNSHKIISWFLNRNSTSKSEENGTIYLKWWNGRTYNQEHSTQQDSHSDLMEKSKALQTSKR